MSGDWHNVELGDVLKYTQPTKFIVESTDYSDEFEVPVLTAGKSFILGHTDEKDGLYVDLPTIIFDDFTTSFHFVDFPFKVKSSAMKMLNLADGACDIKFMYYLMRTIRFDPDEHKRYWISKFSKFRVAVPPFEEQKRIAGILDEADRVRKKTQALIDKYDELAQSLFLDMFGDPVTNPKGWETKTFADVITGMQNGIGKGKEFYGRGEKVANIGDLYKSYDFEPVKYSLLDVTEEEIAKYSLRFGDLLFVRSSLKKEGVAVCSFFNSKDTCLFSSFMIKASPDLSRLDPFFLSSQMRTISYRKLLINAANTATITNISQPNLKRVPVIVPPMEIQEKFSNCLLELKREQQLMLLELKETDKLFNALLQKAFKGELT